MGRGIKLADVAFLGRVGTPANPILLLPGLQGQWRADSFVSPNPTDGSAVGDNPYEWQDQSTNNNDLIRVSGGSTNPTVEYGEINSLPVIRFDGSPAAENLKFNSAITLAGDFTIQMVIRESAGNSALLIANASVNRHIGRRFTAANDMNFFDGVSLVSSSAFTSAVGTTHLCTVRRSGTTVSFRENKTARGSGAAGASVTFNNIALVSYSPQIYLGDFCEIVICNQHLSDATIDALYDSWYQPRWLL